MAEIPTASPRSFMTASACAVVRADLQQRDPTEIVRVLLKPDSPNRPESQALNPRDFESAVAYRTALIEARDREQTPSSTELMGQAQKAGLAAQLGGLNTVLVEGTAGAVLALMDTARLQTALFDRPMNFVRYSEG